MTDVEGGGGRGGAAGESSVKKNNFSSIRVQQYSNHLSIPSVISMCKT